MTNVLKKSEIPIPISAFMPTDTNKLKGQVINKSIALTEIQGAISMNGLRLINESEILAFIAPPGSGKTNLIEAIGAAYVAAKNNIQVDSMGVVTHITKKKVLILDYERTEQDTRLSFDRICKRLDVENNPYLWSGDNLRDLRFMRYLDVPNIEDRKNELKEIIESGEYDLIIIDGLLELISSMNDEIGIKEFFTWLRSLASTNKVNFVVTIHPNKGTDNPGGHLGGYVLKYTRAVLHIKPNNNDRSIKEIYFNPTYGKLAHCNPAEFNPSFMIWENGMFISADTPEKRVNLGFKEDLLIQVFKKSHTLKLQAGILYEKYSNIVKVGKEAARKHIKAAMEAGYLEHSKTGSKYYYTIDSELLNNENDN